MLFKTLKVFWITVLLTTPMIVPRAVHAQRDLVVVDVERTSPKPDGARAKLSPALSATKFGDGILKGSDNLGRPVIALSAEGVERVKANQTIKSITKELPVDWSPITRLKIGYLASDKPAIAELSAMGLRIVEDYGKGSFMLVEPVDGQISAALLDKLESNLKVQHVTAALRTKAIQSGP